MDAALETDVRLLAVMLEDILREQEGPWLATLLTRVIECAAVTIDEASLARIREARMRP